MLEAYAAQLAQLRIEQLIASTAQTALELGFRRTGLAPGSEGELDLLQVELAVETVRALLPLIERLAGGDAATAYRGALSELQLAYARAAEAAGAPPPRPTAQAPPGGGPPPAAAQPPRPKIWTPRGDV